MVCLSLYTFALVSLCSLSFALPLRCNTTRAGFFWLITDDRYSRSIQIQNSIRITHQTHLRAGMQRWTSCTSLKKEQCAPIHNICTCNMKVQPHYNIRKNKNVDHFVTPYSFSIGRIFKIVAYIRLPPIMILVRLYDHAFAHGTTDFRNQRNIWSLSSMCLDNFWCALPFAAWVR